MLYRFSVENFKSFKERSEISFIPNADTCRHVADVGSDIPVLRSAVIYGANASGKSNFIKAIDFVQDLILDNRKLAEEDNMAYRLDVESVNQPTVFSFEIKIEKELYQYGMAVSFSEVRVEEEWLFQLKKEEEDIEIFSRSYDAGNKKYEIDFRYDKDDLNAPRYYTYKEDLSKAMQRLVLTELAQKELEGGRFIEVIKSVYKWFEELIIIFPNSEYNLLGAIAKNQKTVNNLYKKYFKVFGIDIEDIHITQIPLHFASIPPKILSKIKMDLQRNEKEDNMAMLHSNGLDYLVQVDDKNELRISEVKFTHKNGDYSVEFNKRDESDGTQRLFDLIPMMGYIINEDRVVIVDEIDRSLHCLLTRELFEHFFKNSKNRKSQLICSTHDILLLDLALLNKEEIWFVNKEKSGSVIYPLNKFKVEKDAINIDRNYLLGRYKGTPEFNE